MFRHARGRGTGTPYHDIYGLAYRPASGIEDATSIHIPFWGSVLPRSRVRTSYNCQSCGYQSARWLGFCPSCQQRSPLVESQTSPSARGGASRPVAVSSEELSQVTASNQPRLAVPFDELSRVLGGGLVPGSVVLMAGEPGVGKSTLLLQAAQHVARDTGQVAYVCGEESAYQVRLRADRLGLSGSGIQMLAETDVGLVLQRLEAIEPALVMVDSVQTLHQPDVGSGPGSASQVRECGLMVTRWAKERSVPTIMTGHITKDGNVAGPMVLEHMVDVVLQLEADEVGHYRLLRSIKNRFGSTNEIGVFSMGSKGMEEVPDPSSTTLAQRGKGAVGSAIVPVIEGTRPLLVEVQALTSPTVLPVPRRIANGFDFNRLLMLVAVLTRRVGINLSGQDVIVNVAGGFRVREPAADLAVALAIVSSSRDAALDPNLAALGEVGLSGELRGVSQVERRLSELGRLGFSSCLVPASFQDKMQSAGVQPKRAATLRQAISTSLASHTREEPPFG